MTKTEVPSSSGLNDEALILDVVRGTPGALERLFDHLFPLIHAQVRPMSELSIQERRDMVGQISLWLTEELKADCEGFRAEKGTPRAYFRRIIQRKGSRYRRGLRANWLAKTVYGEDGAEIEAAPADVADVAAQVEASELWGAVLESVDRFDERDRYIFFHRIVGEAASRDVADFLGISRDLVDARVHRLKTALRVHLECRGWSALLWMAVLFGGAALFGATLFKGGWI